MIVTLTVKIIVKMKILWNKMFMKLQDFCNKNGIKPSSNPIKIKMSSSKWYIQKWWNLSIPVKFTATCDKNPNPRVKNGKQMHFFRK